jgi:F-type H+-transporting ATPase subunit alpha
MLKQPQYKPMPVEDQIMIIYAATQKYLLDIPTDKVLEFESALFEHVKTKYPEIPESIREKKVLEEDMEKLLIQAINEAKKPFVQE